MCTVYIKYVGARIKILNYRTEEIAEPKRKLDFSFLLQQSYFAETFFNDPGIITHHKNGLLFIFKYIFVYLTDEGSLQKQTLH